MNNQQKKNISLRTVISMMALTTGHGAQAALTDIPFDSEVDRQAAEASQARYEALKAEGCTDEQSEASESCGGDDFRAWQQVRSLVHTANAIDRGLTDSCDTYVEQTEPEGEDEPEVVIDEPDEKEQPVEQPDEEEYGGPVDDGVDEYGGNNDGDDVAEYGGEVDEYGGEFDEYGGDFDDEYGGNVDEYGGDIARGSRIARTYNAPGDDAPVNYCLRTSQQGLSRALRNTAGEEFLAHGNLTKHFARVEFQSLQNYLGTLRHGSRGFNWREGDTMQALGGGASADSAWSSWGGFVDLNQSSGEQDQTAYESAFDFDSYTINAGIDYRLNGNWVVGATFGLYENELDFETASGQDDGNIDTDGYSLMPFVMFHSDLLYFSAALGYQSYSFDNKRQVNIESGNAQVSSIAATLDSSNDADALLANLTVGGTYRPLPALTIDPYVAVNWQGSDIDGFREKDDGNANALEVDGRDVDVLETITAVKMQYTFTPSWGVISPYVDIQWFGQHETDPDFINTQYTGAASGSVALRANQPDADYKIYSAGIYTILRGAAQKDYGGPASGSIQAYLSAYTLQDYGDYDETTVYLGVRYEF